MGDNVGKVGQGITADAGHGTVIVGGANGPVDKQRPAHDVGARHKSPEAAVQALVAVVTQHKVFSRRHHQFAIVNQGAHLQPPARFHPGGDKVGIGEVVVVGVVRR